MKLTSILPGMRVALIFRVVMILVILSTISAQGALSQEANAPEVLPTWTKISVDAPPYFLNMRDRSLAYNPLYNIPCMAYGGDALYYSCWNDNTDTWNTVLVDSSLSVGQYTALAFDNYYRPFITYYDAWNGRLKLAYHSGGTWHIQVVPNPTVFAPTTLTAEESALTGEPASAETPTSAGEPTPTGAPASVVEPTPTGESTPTGELTPTGEPTPAEEPATSAEATPSAPVETLAADEEPTTLERIEQILAALPGEDAPMPNFQIGTAIGYGKFSSIAIDRSNGIHISFYDELNRTLDYQYWNGITFDGVVVHHYNDQGRTGLWTSIAVDFNFGVHIAFMSEKYDNLMYAYRAPNQWPQKKWRVETAHGDTATSRVNVGSFASLALDNHYRPHISYYDFTNENLKHAWRDRTGVWHSENVDPTGNMGWYTSIAIDSDNRIHISYYNVTKGTLKYARYSGGDWTLKTLDDNDWGKAGMFTSIALDVVNERPGIFYTHGGNGSLKYIHATNANASNWSNPSSVSSYFRDVGQATSLALNTAGMPFISYLDSTVGYLKYARSYGSMWYRNYVRTDLNAGLYSSIALAGEYTPHVAYYDQTHGNLVYSNWTGSAWVHTKVDQAHNVGKYVSLEIDSARIPHISYYDATHGDLLYASYDTLASHWYTDTVDTLQNTGMFTSITVNAANLPYISYYDHTGGSLNMAFKSPTTLTWVVEPIDNVGRTDLEDVGISSSIALDSAGRPNISYYDMINHDLKYAYWEGTWGGIGSWIVTTLDSVGDVGMYSSLAIDTATDTRHLCYYDFTNGNLKYAQKVGAAAWEFQVVDGDVTDGDGINEGDVGYYCSIDLNGLGQPAISYYDNSHGDLKIAMSYPMPPMPQGDLYLPLVLR